MLIVVTILLVLLLIIEIGAVIFVKRIYDIDGILNINIKKYDQATMDRDSYRNKMQSWMRFAMSTWDYELMARVIACESKGSPKEEIASVILNRLKSHPVGTQNIADVLIDGHFISVNDGEAYEADPGRADYNAIQRSVLKDYADGRKDLDHEIYF